MVKWYSEIVAGKTYYVKKSGRKNKKYDVYDSDKEKYITSFGDKRYWHYKDKFGDYSHMNHGDENRRINYKKRAEGIGFLNDPKHANFWAYNYLW